MSDLMRVPAVFNFAADDGGPILTGYAAPVAGHLPCVLKLLSDGEPILYAKASRFSAAAAEAGVRLGWCGFELAGVSKAFAIGDRVEVACAGSGRILHRVMRSDTSVSGLGERQISAEDVIRAGTRGETCSGPSQLAPFMMWHRQRYGPRALVEASFQTLFGRWPEPAAMDNWASKLVDEKACVEFIGSLMRSDEFLRRPMRELPGPFHQAFRYDRGLIG